VRTTLEHRIEALDGRLQVLGRILRGQLMLARKALANGTHPDEDDLAAGELELNRASAELDWEILQTIALEAPVAGDLRLLAGLLHVSDHLERMGDLCCNLARTGHRLAGARPPGGIGVLLDEMGEYAERAMDVALDSLATRDLDLAESLPELDRPLDELNQIVFERIDQAGTVGAGGGRLGWAVQVVLAARFLERLGDHAVDIAEQVGFILTGEVREFVPSKAARAADA
jgi:phosphate transport system protein